jgi:hypothetical protein
MIVIHLFLTLLDIAFFVGLAIACVSIPILALNAFGRALDRRMHPSPPSPRPLPREEKERLKHEAFMAQERERLDRLA